MSDLPRDESLDESEAALVEAVNGRLEAMAGVLELAPGEALTLDELSALVYDPFPAPVRVAVSGKVLDREGFPGSFDSALTIPRLSLWSAYTRLSGRFIAPDLALALWRSDIDGIPVDLDALVALPRHAIATPDAAEIRRAIERDLVPASVYRVRWAPAASDTAPTPFDLP